VNIVSPLMGIETRILFSFGDGLRARSASEGKCHCPSLALRALKGYARRISWAKPLSS